MNLGGCIGLGQLP